MNSVPSGSSSKTYDLNNYSMSNAVSSWICGDAVKYRFCTDTTSDCTGSHLFSGAGSAQTEQSENDDAKYLELSTYDAAKQGAIILFQASECRNISAYYLANADVNEPA